MKVTYDMDCLDIATMTALFWEALALKWKRSGHNPVTPTYKATYDDICISLFELALSKGLVKKPYQQNGYIERYFTEITQQKIGSILWGLVSQQVLYITFRSERIGNSGYTDKMVFDITEYGLQVLKQGKPIPHDPDGYLLLLKKEVPHIDEIVYTYAAESIQAYNNHLLLSATTAIGCASEKALLLLIEAYTHFLPTEKEQQAFIKKTSGRFIKTQFEEFQKSFAGQQARIDKSLLDGIDIVINGIFELLRQNRNSTGHPTGKAMERESVYALLQVFIVYLKRIYALMKFFQDNPVHLS